MNASRADLIVALLPYLLLGIGAVACAVVTLASRGRATRACRAIATVTLLGLAGTALLELYRERFVAGGIYVFAGGTTSSRLASGTLVVDKLSIACLVFFATLALISVVTSADTIGRLHLRGGGFYAFLLTATEGACVIVSQREMTSLLLGVGLLTVSVTILSALLKTDERALEAAFKYGVSSAVGLATLLLGMAVVYGLTASTDPHDLAAQAGHSPALAAVGIGLVVVGLGVLMGSSPLPQWVPGIAEALPAPAAGFILSVTISSVLVALFRFTVSGFGTAVPWWPGVIGVLAVISILYGALGALRQTSVRRMVGYLVVAQTGFALLSLVGTGPGSDSLNAGGSTLFLFTTIVNGVTVAALFGAIAVLESRGVGERLRDYRGLSRRDGAWTFFLAVALVALAGLPPSANFIGRLLTFQSAVYANYSWTAGAALVGMALATVAVLRLLVVMLHEPENGKRLQHAGSRLAALFAAVWATLLVLMVLLSQPLLALATGATLLK